MLNLKTRVSGEGCTSLDSHCRGRRPARPGASRGRAARGVPAAHGVPAPHRVHAAATPMVLARGGWRRRAGFTCPSRRRLSPVPGAKALCWRSLRASGAQRSLSKTDDANPDGTRASCALEWPFSETTTTTTRRRGVRTLGDAAARSLWKPGPRSLGAGSPPGNPASKRAAAGTEIEARRLRPASPQHWSPRPRRGSHTHCPPANDGQRNRLGHVQLSSIQPQKKKKKAPAICDDISEPAGRHPRRTDVA